MMSRPEFRLTLTILSGLLVLVLGSGELSCHEWCSDPCTALNGDVTQECNGCSEPFACRPGAEGYSRPSPPPIANEVLTEAPHAEGDVPWSHCRVLPAAELEAKTDAEIADVMRQPILITGLLDGWTVPSDRAGLLARFGHHQLMARRTDFAAIRDSSSFGNREDRAAAELGRDGVDRTPGVPHVTVAEYMDHMHEEHIVMYDGEPGRSAPEE